MDPATLTLSEAAGHLRRGDLGAEAYVSALLARCELWAALNAFITPPGDDVLEAARQADARRARGEPLGPLHGVPFTAKDNLDTAGLPTTGGTPALRGHRPRRNARVIQQLLDAGALLFGKSNLHELAYGITSNNAYFGPVRNPYAPDRIAGGSSGGTAAAVSARLVPAGLGTDTGGSVRIPAALCGVAGLRPTVGRYSQEGMLLISSTRDAIGPIARSATDLALLDEVITGAMAATSPLELRGLRLGVPRAPFYQELDPPVARIVEERLAQLRDHGVVLVETSLPDLSQLMDKAGFPIAFYETIPSMRRYLAESAAGVSLDELVEQIRSPDVRHMLSGLLGPAAVPEAVYRESLTVHRPALLRAFASYFAEHGIAAILLPTTPLAASPIGEDETVQVADQRISTFLAYIRNTNPASIIGLPGLTLPAGLTPQGLPVGMEVDGPPGHDRALLALGCALEALWPPLPPPPLVPVLGRATGV